MKKSIASIAIIIIAIIILSIILTGCLNYKSYDLPKEENPDDAQLVDKIAQIEQELSLEASAPTEEVVKDVVLPELSDEPVEDVPEGEMRVINVKENQFVRLKATIVDADKDPITFTYGKPLNERGEWKTNYGDAGEYIVVLSATDGKLTTTQKIKLLVERINVPPVIDGVRDLTIKEGESVAFTPKVTDPNNDKVTVTISEPLTEEMFKTDHTSAGEYQITVTASDGELQTEKTFKLTITNVNVLPVITNVDNVNIKEGEAVVIKPEVSDLDNEPLTVTISDPIGDDGVWETDFTNHGEYMVTISASDGKDTVTKKIRVVVEDVNVPPQIVDITLETS